jgi:hypothetical protein
MREFIKSDIVELIGPKQDRHIGKQAIIIGYGRNEDHFIIHIMGQSINSKPKYHKRFFKLIKRLYGHKI